MELARELEITRVLIPPFPGTFSAWGMLQSDIRHDLSVSHVDVLGNMSPEALQSLFEPLEAQGAEKLASENVSEAQMSFDRTLDLRYVGQEYTVRVSIGKGDTIDAISDRFHQAYDRKFGHSQKASPVELITARLAAIGKFNRSKANAADVDPAVDPVISKREITFDGAVHASPIMRREHMAQGKVFASPAVIEEESATTVVPPGYTISIDAFSNMIIEQEGAE